MYNNLRGDTMIRDEIKAKIIESGFTMSEVVEMINEKYGKNMTIQMLSNKLSRGKIPYAEVKEIADVIDYKIEWIKKDPGN